MTPKAALITWLVDLPDNSPDLARVESVMRGVGTNVAEPLLSLKDAARELGYLHYSSLTRLHVRTVGESLGAGRIKYRLSTLRKYLCSPECEAIRSELRAKRKQRAGKAP